MAVRIDMNCDMGESFGMYKMGLDEEIIRHVSSANIACGFHAGDPTWMRTTVRLAEENGVAVGAHPSYPDLVGFGRRNMNATADEVKCDVAYQLGALQAFTDGKRLQHVKPHGAMYNQAVDDEDLARAICEAALEFDPNIILVALAGSKWVGIASEMGMKVAPEIFADRRPQCGRDAGVALEAGLSAPRRGRGGGAERADGDGGGGDGDHRGAHRGGGVVDLHPRRHARRGGDGRAGAPGAGGQRRRGRSDGRASLAFEESHPHPSPLPSRERGFWKVLHEQAPLASIAAEEGHPHPNPLPSRERGWEAESPLPVDRPRAGFNLPPRGEEANPLPSRER